MTLNKKYMVEGSFVVPFKKYVTAKTNAEALRKARDSALNTKIKIKHLDKVNDVNVIELP